MAPLAAVAAGTLAALAGVWSAHLAAPAHRAPPSPRIVSIGPAQLSVPGEWQPVPARRVGFAWPDAQRAVAFETQPGLPVWALAVFAPTAESSLIPTELRSAFAGRAPAPTATRVAGWPAWTYRDLTASRSAARASVTVLPTTAGVLAIACTTRSGSAADLGCASEVASVAVRGGGPFVPSRSLALELAVPPVLDELNRSRHRHRLALTRAGSPAAQAAAARRLTADHRRAARAIRAAAGPAGVPLVRGLTRAADAYDALVTAAETASPDAFAAARGAVREAEGQLASEVRGVARPVLARVSQPGGTRSVRAAQHGSGSGGVPPLVFALLVLLAAVAGVATGGTGTPMKCARVLSLRGRAS